MLIHGSKLPILGEINDLFAFLKENRSRPLKTFSFWVRGLEILRLGDRIPQLQGEIIQLPKLVRRVETEPEPVLNVYGGIAENATESGEEGDSQSATDIQDHDPELLEVPEPMDVFPR